MPMTPEGWRVDPFVTWRDRARDGIDGHLGAALDYDGTPEGAIVDQVADGLWDLDQGGQSLFDALSPLSAAPGQLAIIGEAEGIRRKRATTSIYEVRAQLASGAASVLIPSGTVFRHAGLEWVSESDEIVDDGGKLIVRAAEAGPVFLPVAGADLEIVTPVSGVEGAVRDPSDFAQLGRPRESIAAYRIRLQRTPLGSRIERNVSALDFVAAVSVEVVAPAKIVVRVVPTPAPGEQRQQVAQAIHDAWIGTFDEDLPDPITVNAAGVDGFPVPITYYAGVQQPVNASALVELEPGAALSVVQSLSSDAFEALFAPLPVGGGVRWTDYYAAIGSVDGVRRVITTPADTWLGASTEQDDVEPSASTDLLVPGTLTVTAAS